LKCELFYPSFSTLPNENRSRTLDLFEGTWASAAADYYSEFIGKRAVGKNTPRGIQKFLNIVITESLRAQGWTGSEGRYTKESEWLRVSFRHMMSAGSDIMDAARMAKVENYETVTLVSASPEFLKVISPADAGSLCSSEVHRAQVTQNQFALDIPIRLGKLEPTSSLDLSIRDVVFGKR
jgi:hypothetical protein